MARGLEMIDFIANFANFEDIMIFWLYGAMAFACIVAINLTIIMVKYSNFDEVDRIELSKFFVHVTIIKKQPENRTKMTIRFFILLLFPAFNAALGLFVTYYLLTKSGLYSVITAFDAKERFHLVPVVTIAYVE